MTTQFRRNSNQDMIAQINEGMIVYDCQDQRVGVVEFVKFTDEDTSTPPPDAVGRIDNYSTQSFWGGLTTVFDDPDDISDTMRSRLVREGYLRIDGGFLAPDRIALLDQIADVNHDAVTLTVTRDELILL